MHYPWDKFPMLKSWLEAAEEEDEIIPHRSQIGRREAGKKTEEEA
jgi:hypothetical protein